MYMCGNLGDPTCKRHLEVFEYFRSLIHMQLSMNTTMDETVNGGKASKSLARMVMIFSVDGLKNNHV